MKQTLFILAICLVSCMAENWSDNPDTKKEPNPVQLREYQIEVFNDSTVIWDGERHVITLPYDSTQSLDKAINQDNQ
jgi:hypothetical protein